MKKLAVMAAAALAVFTVVAFDRFNRALEAAVVLPEWRR